MKILIEKRSLTTWLARLGGLLLLVYPSVRLIESELSPPGRMLAVLAIGLLYLMALGFTYRPGLSGVVSGAILLFIITAVSG
jgi:uncharacterized membrane protein